MVRSFEIFQYQPIQKTNANATAVSPQPQPAPVPAAPASRFEVFQYQPGAGVAPAPPTEEKTFRNLWGLIGSDAPEAQAPDQPKAHQEDGVSWDKINNPLRPQLVEEAIRENLTTGKPGPQMISALTTPPGMDRQAQEKAVRVLSGDAPPERSWLDSLYDAGKAVNAGVHSGVGTAVGYGMEAAGKKLEAPGLADFGAEMRHREQAEGEKWLASLSPEGRAMMAKQLFDGFSPNLDDQFLGSLMLKAFQSAPGMIATAPVGGALSKGIGALGGMVLPKVAGALVKGTASPVGRSVIEAAKTQGLYRALADRALSLLPSSVGFGAAEGGMAGLQNAAQLRSEIEGMSPDQLYKTSPTFRTYVADANGDIKAAQARLARDAAGDVALKTAISTGAIGVLTGGGAMGMVARQGERKAAEGVLKSAAKGFAEEWAQETPQSGGEAYIENVARRDYVDPSIDPMHGVVSQAMEGGLVGGVSGFGLGMGGGVVQALQAPKPVAQPATSTGAAATETARNASGGRAATGAGKSFEEARAEEGQGGFADFANRTRPQAPPPGGSGSPSVPDQPLGSVGTQAQGMAEEKVEGEGVPAEGAVNPFAALKNNNLRRAHQAAWNLLQQDPENQAHQQGVMAVETEMVARGILERPTFAPPVEEEAPQVVPDGLPPEKFDHYAPLFWKPALEASFPQPGTSAPAPAPEIAGLETHESGIGGVGLETHEIGMGDVGLEPLGIGRGNVGIESRPTMDGNVGMESRPTGLQEAPPVLSEKIGGGNPVEIPQAPAPSDGVWQYEPKGFVTPSGETFEAVQGGDGLETPESGMGDVGLETPESGMGDVGLETRPTMDGNVGLEPRPTDEMGAPVERRQDLETRKRIDEMTPEELRLELMTSPKTGLKNDRAYAEAPRRPIQASVDLDSLKWVNDNLGHAAGDSLLQHMGDALRGHDDAYHVSGDEFVVQGDTKEEVETAIKSAYDYLDGNEIIFEGPDGVTHILKGGFSYGIGRNLEEADRALHVHKGQRELSGDRAGRGEKPPGYRQGEPGRTAVYPEEATPAGSNDAAGAGQPAATQSAAAPAATGADVATQQPAQPQQETPVVTAQPQPGAPISPVRVMTTHGEYLFVDPADLNNPEKTQLRSLTPKGVPVPPTKKKSGLIHRSNLIDMNDQVAVDLATKTGRSHLLTKKLEQNRITPEEAEELAALEQEFFNRPEGDGEAEGEKVKAEGVDYSAEIAGAEADLLMASQKMDAALAALEKHKASKYPKDPKARLRYLHKTDELTKTLDEANQGQRDAQGRLYSVKQAYAEDRLKKGLPYRNTWTANINDDVGIKSHEIGMGDVGLETRPTGVPEIGTDRTAGGVASEQDGGLYPIQGGDEATSSPHGKSIKGARQWKVTSPIKHPSKIFEDGVSNSIQITEQSNGTFGVFYKPKNEFYGRDYKTLEAAHKAATDALKTIDESMQQPPSPAKAPVQPDAVDVGMETHESGMGDVGLETRPTGVPERGADSAPAGVTSADQPGVETVTPSPEAADVSDFDRRVAASRRETEEREARLVRVAEREKQWQPHFSVFSEPDGAHFSTTFQKNLKQWVTGESATPPPRIHGQKKTGRPIPGKSIENHGVTNAMKNEAAKKARFFKSPVAIFSAFSQKGEPIGAGFIELPHDFRGRAKEAAALDETLLEVLVDEASGDMKIEHIAYPPEAADVGLETRPTENNTPDASGVPEMGADSEPAGVASADQPGVETVTPSPEAAGAAQAASLIDERHLPDNINAPTLVEYLTREIFKRKGSLNAAVKNVHAKFNMAENQILGKGRLDFTPEQLKKAYVADKIKTYVKKGTKEEYGYLTDNFHIKVDDIADTFPEKLKDIYPQGNVGMESLESGMGDVGLETRPTGVPEMGTDSAPAGVASADQPGVETVTPPPKAAGAAEPVSVVERADNDITVKTPMPKAQAEGLSPKEQKKYLLKEIDTALSAATEVDPGHPYKKIKSHQDAVDVLKKEFGTVTIEVPGDGEFTVINTRQHLAEFKKRAQDFPVSAVSLTKKPAVKTPTRGRVGGADVEYFNAYKPVPRRSPVVNPSAEHVFYQDGYFSDGRSVVAMPERPAVKKPYIEKTPNNFVPEIKREVERFQGADKPLTVVGEFSHVMDGNDTGPKVHLRDADGNDYFLAAERVDHVMTLHPNARPFVNETSATGNAPVVWKTRDNVSAIVAPVIVDKETLTERQLERMEELAGGVEKAEGGSVKGEEIPTGPPLVKGGEDAVDVGLETRPADGPEESPDIFIRKPTQQERPGGAARNRGFNDIPDKPGYEKVYKPYGEQGEGYYYSPVKKESAAAGDVGLETRPTKEPWQVRVAEYVASAKTPDEVAIAKSAHANHVKQAVMEGRDVPLDVLEGYKYNGWAEKAIAAKGNVGVEPQPGDTIRFTPHEKYGMVQEGIVRESINDGDGFHVFTGGKENPYQVSRIWKDKGKIEILKRAAEEESPAAAGLETRPTDELDLNITKNLPKNTFAAGEKEIGELHDKVESASIRPERVSRNLPQTDENIKQGETKAAGLKVYPGDNVEFKTPGGGLTEGSVRKVLPSGDVDVTAFGQNFDQRMKLENITRITKENERPRRQEKLAEDGVQFQQDDGGADAARANVGLKTPEQGMGDVGLETRPTEDLTDWNAQAEEVMRHVGVAKVVYEGQADFVANGPAGAATAKAYYDPKTNTIHINTDKADKTTIFHEFAHPAVNRVRAANPAFYEEGMRLAGGSEEALVQAIAEKGANIQARGNRSRFLAWLDKLYASVRRMMKKVFRVEMSLDEFAEAFAYGLREKGGVEGLMAEGRGPKAEGKADAARVGVGIKSRPTGAVFQERDERAFAEQIDDFVARGEAGQKNYSKLITVGPTPDVLVRLGVQQLPVTMSAKVTTKILNDRSDRPGMSVDTLKRLPSALANPIMVFDSKTAPGESLVVVTDLKDSRGKTVIAAVYLHQINKRHEVHAIGSVYGKENNQWFVDQIKEGRIRYAHKNKSRQWLQSAGLQLPLEEAINGSGKKILFDSDIVKEEKGEVQFQADEETDGSISGLESRPSWLRRLIENHPGVKVWDFLSRTGPEWAGEKSDLIDKVNAALITGYREDAAFSRLRKDTEVRLLARQEKAKELSRILATFPDAEQARIGQIIEGSVTMAPKRYAAALKVAEEFKALEAELQELGLLGPENRFRQLTRKELAAKFKEIDGIDAQIRKLEKQLKPEIKTQIRAEAVKISEEISEAVTSDMTTRPADVKTSLGKAFAVNEQRVKDALMARGFADGESQTMIDRIKASVVQTDVPAGATLAEIKETITRTITQTVATVMETTKSYPRMFMARARGSIVRDINKLRADQAKSLNRIQLHYKMAGKQYLRMAYDTIENDKKFLRHFRTAIKHHRLRRGYEIQRKDYSEMVRKAKAADLAEAWRAENPGKPLDAKTRMELDAKAVDAARREFAKWKWDHRLAAPVLAMKGMSEEAHDAEMFRLFKAIADNPEWAVARIPKDDGDGGLGDVGLETRPTRDYHRWKQLQKSDKLGPVSGMWVRPEIYDYLQTTVDQRSQAGKVYDEILRLWKTGKVVMNPAAQARNIMSNIILADMAGLHIHQVPTYLRAVKDYRNKGDFWKEAQAAGLFGVEWAGHEITAFLDGMDNLDPKADSIWANAAKFSKALLAVPGKSYQGIEQFYKLAVYINERQKGKSIADAKDHAEKWLFNYTDLPPAIRWARRWYSPFITFTYKAMPRFAEIALTKPWKLVKYWALMQGVELLTRSLRGESDDDQEKEEKVLPAYMRREVLPGQLSHLRVPYTDEYGRSKYLDMSYILPWGDIGEQWGQSSITLVPRSFLPSHPGIIFAGEWAFNEVLFTGEELFGEHDTVTDKALALAGNAWRSAAPSLAPGGFGYNKLMAAATGERDWAGRDRNFAEAVFDTVLGLKVRSIDYTEEREKRMMEFKRDIGDIKAEYKRDVKDLYRKFPDDPERQREKGEALVVDMSEKIERVVEKVREMDGK